MISKQQSKFVKSLKLKKYRKNAASFLVEGAKNVQEVLTANYKIRHLFVTNKFLDEYPQFSGLDYNLCTEKELISIGTFQSNEYALAVASMKDQVLEMSNVGFAIALDDVSDPGNLGTIIRIADWYGIDIILASKETADFYNPKVISASMGSFTRVTMHYVDLSRFLSLNTTHRIYGAMLQGNNIYKTKFSFPSILLMGNESNGISPSLINFVDEQVTIPKIGGAESLNVAVSTAIMCDNIFRP